MVVCCGVLQATCSSLNEYLRGPLGRYLLNVTSAAEQCSRNLCGFRGRCLRKQPNTDTYLHLSASTHRIERQANTLKLTGQMSEEELGRLRDDFQCQCYNGYSGDDCSVKDNGNRAASLWTSALQNLVLPLILMGFLHWKLQRGKTLCRFEHIRRCFKHACGFYV